MPKNQKIIITKNCFFGYNVINEFLFSKIETKITRKGEINMAKKPAKLDVNGHRKFGIRDSAAYMMGDLGCNMSFALKSTMALFWTQVMGLSKWYSLLLIVVQVWDAINDPLIGSIIDADKRVYKKRNKFVIFVCSSKNFVHTV